ncbi:hypothetical protein [Streptomyces sp. NPDC055912]|uniref:hypothetical protein n=1 Tax=Streptomyces sp. NPDC055912 TaxID=3345660 RepID=UPI0035D6E8B8
MYDEKNTVAVDVRALVVGGHTTFADVAAEELLHLEEDTLGMKAGLWYTDGGTYTLGARQGRLRDLAPVTDEEAAELVVDGAPIHDARLAPDWTCAFPALVVGLSLGELRAALANIDLPDEAIVAIRSAEFPRQGAGSPASPRVEAGYYRPDPARASSGEAFGGPIDSDEDGTIPAHLPALVLRPTH